MSDQVARSEALDAQIGEQTPGMRVTADDQAAHRRLRALVALLIAVTALSVFFAYKYATEQTRAKHALVESRQATAKLTAALAEVASLNTERDALQTRLRAAVTPAQFKAITDELTSLSNQTASVAAAGIKAASTPGPEGPAGAVGAQGTPGINGAAGAPGLNGVDGAAGPQGAPGGQGPAGPAGGQGPPGAQGPAGAEGPPGPQGPQGPPGPQGDPGPAGPQGPPGQPGQPATTIP